MFISAMIVGVLLVGITIIVHYEALRLTSDLLPRLAVPPRARIIVVVFAAFAAHMVEIWIYALAYLVCDRHLGFGGFGGELPVADIRDYLYFSVGTYTTLGLGDVFPTRELRLLAGIESLNGLLLIGWSASFTYLTMEKFWPLHAGRRRG